MTWVHFKLFDQSVSQADQDRQKTQRGRPTHRPRKKMLEEDTSLTLCCGRSNGGKNSLERITGDSSEWCRSYDVNARYE